MIARGEERFEDYLIQWEKAHSHALSFRVVCVITDSPTMIYGRGLEDFIEDPAKAPTFLHGDVKWDGCSNIYFDEQDTIMLHFCGMKMATGVGRLLQRMYEIAAANIERFDHKLAGVPK